MGLIYHDAKRLWQARLAGCSFQRVLTVAHQQFYLHPGELQALRRSWGDRAGQGESEAVSAPLAGYRFGEYADRFLKEFLHAGQIEIVDYSGYEGATLVHDLNVPIPPEHEERFDAVIEAGSLEHIFNFPVAIQNLMLMAKVGGTLFLTTVANNLCGHGFYQFSPELIYRIFCPENGFEKPDVVFLEADYPWVELTPIRAAYRVMDPKDAGTRVGLQSSHPFMMMVQTRKISAVRPFRSNPQQSDYTAAWGASSVAAPATRPGSLKSTMFRWLPDCWQREVEGYRTRLKYSIRNRRFYRKL